MFWKGLLFANIMSDASHQRELTEKEWNTIMAWFAKLGSKESIKKFAQCFAIVCLTIALALAMKGIVIPKLAYNMERQLTEFVEQTQEDVERARNFGGASTERQGRGQGFSDSTDSGTK